jgi:hypothetical protein
LIGLLVGREHVISEQIAALRALLVIGGSEAARGEVFAVGGCFSFFLGVGLYGATFLLPVYLRLVHDHGALAIGEIMMVTGAAQLVMAPVATFLERRVDTRLLIAVLERAFDRCRPVGGAEHVYEGAQRDRHLAMARIKPSECRVQPSACQSAEPFRDGCRVQPGKFVGAHSNTVRPSRQKFGS